MASVSLYFEGSRNQVLLVTILLVILVSLVAAGTWHFIRRRWRQGVLCMAAAVGPVALVPVLVSVALSAYVGGRKRQAAAPLIGAAALFLASVGALAFVALADTGEGPWWRSGAFWLSMLGLWVPMAIGVFYAAVFAHLGSKRITALMVLRCLAILALLLVLFKPSISIAPDISQYKPYLPILVDRSGSMSVKPRGAPGVDSRYRQCLQMLGIEQDRLSEHFRLAWYQFAEDVHEAENLDSLAEQKPSGEGTKTTDIAGAIRAAAGHFHPRQVPGMLVLTDGVHNASGPNALRSAATDVGLRLFTVGVGSQSDEAEGGRNIRLAEVNVPYEAIKNNVTDLHVRVRLSGFAGDPGEVQLREEGGGEPVIIERLWTDKDFDTVSMDLKWTPKSVGAPGEDTDVTSAVRKLWISVPVKQGESIKDDNEAEIHVLVTEPKLRVLYVEGKMRSEYRFLKRLFDTDPNVQFASLIRIAENRFWSYGAVDGKKFTGLPTTDKDFERLDVIILGSLDRTFLEQRTGAGRGRMKKIAEWVNAGGGLLMIGGLTSFGPGGYTNTEIEKVLPVVVGGRRQPQETTAFVPQLTALGERHEIFEGITGYFFGPGGRKPRDDLPKLPNLSGCVTVETAKPGARLLAIHPTSKNAAGPLVVLAVQPVGAGRTAAFTGDTTWRWYFPLRAKGADSPYERFWGQLVRWLAKVDTKTKESKPTVMLRFDRSYLQVSQPLKIVARVQDAGGRPIAEGGQASCMITRTDGRGDPETLPLARQTDAKLFVGTFRPSREGEYLIKATAYDAGGKALGADELKLHVAPFSAEMARVALDERTLRDVAKDSRGKYYEITGLPELVSEIIRLQERRAGPVPQPKRYPIDDLFWLLFLLFVTFATVEWIMRRVWQLQ